MPNERASHLNVCPSPDRTRQFHESVEDLTTWLNTDHTHPEIAFWVPKYLLGRDRVKFMSLQDVLPNWQYVTMSSQMKMIAVAQDHIGWRHFLEGKITGHFKSLQSIHLRHIDCRMNGDDWTKQFIARLLKISHTQWFFRNFSLHDAQQGQLARLRPAFGGPIWQLK